MGVATTLNVDETPIVVKAEEAEVTEKVYTYEQDENNVATITLRSDFTFHINVISDGELLIDVEGSYTREGNVVTLVYNGESLVIEVNDATMSFFEYVEKEGEGFIDKVNDFKDTYLVPLLSGVSITSVLSAIISICFAIVNRKTNGKIKSSNDETADLANGIIKSANTLIESINTQTKLEDEVMKKCIDQTRECIGKVAELTNSTDKLCQIKEAIEKLAKLQTIIASHSQELVSMGIAEELNKLLEDIKSLK